MLSHFLSEHIVKRLVLYHYISEKNKDNYQYCINYLLSNAFYILLIIITGSMIHQIAVSILYLITVIPLRSTCGGFHASSRLACSILSYGLWGICLLAYFFLPLPGFIYEVMLYSVCFLLIWCISSVATKKQLDSDSYRRLQYKKKIILSLNLLTFLLLHFIFKSEYTKIMTICMTLCAINALIGQAIVNKQRNEDFV